MGHIIAAMRKEIISNSAVFHESVFLFRQLLLSAVNKRIDPDPPSLSDFPVSAPVVLCPTPVEDVSIHIVPPNSWLQLPLSPINNDLDPPAIQSLSPPIVVAPPPLLVTSPHPPSQPLPEPVPNVPWLVPHVHLPPDILERLRTPPKVWKLLSNFEHHLSHEPLPPAQPTQACQPGALVEDALSTESLVHIYIPVLDAVEFAFSSGSDMEPRSLAEALRCPDADKWVEAVLKEIEAHIKNGTWELTQLPPGCHAIGSRWVFKVKRALEGLVDKYKGQLVAQGFSQVPGVHSGEVFMSTAHFAAVRTVMVLAAAEDMELEAVDVSMAFLNGDIDVELYMRIPEGFEVEGEPHNGEDPKRWVVKLLKGLYGIKQGPWLWGLKLHSILTTLGFQRIDCDYSIYVYQRDGVKIFMLVYVDNLLLASNSKVAIQWVKNNPALHFTIHDQGHVTSILGVKVLHDCAACTISLSQPGYIKSILEDFNMSDCNLVSMPMEQNIKLSKMMSPSTSEGKEEMKKIPYCKLVRKLLYLTVATHPDISYTVRVLCRFVKNPGHQHWGTVKWLL